MADTIRSLADLLVLLANNTSGAISPQDARDVLVSVLGVHAEVYTHAGSTGVSVGTSPVTVQWDTDGDEVGLDADAANDRIAVGTGCAGKLEVRGTFSFSGTASTTFTLHLAKNGTPQNALSCQAKTDAAGGVVSCAFAGVVAVADADALTVQVEADGASKTFTLLHGQLVARRAA